MKYTRTMVCITFACSSQCMGQDVFKYYRGDDGSRVVEQVSAGELQPQTNFHAYDNWRGPAFGGNTTESHGIFQYGEAEVADDLILVTQGPSLITDIGFSIRNTSTFSTLTQYRVTHRFYDSQRILLGSDSFTIVDAPIAAGRGAAFYSDAGFYAPFGIVVPPNVYMSIQISNVVGIDPSDIGILMVGPRTTGYSSQFTYDFTSGQTLDFDGSDQTNMHFFINTADVPTPAATTLFISSLLISCRRRK